MKKKTLIAAALCLLLTMPLHGYAEKSRLPANLRESTLHPTPKPTAEESVETPEPVISVSAPRQTAVPRLPEPESGHLLLGHHTAPRKVDMAAYYLTEMTEAATAGDVRAGREAEKARSAALAAGGTGERVRFDELYLLARVIDAMAGSDWLSDDFRMCVGEVVLNRVASPEFPDTLFDVVYQRGQYTVVNTAHFAALIPRRECVEDALRLLQGERHMAPAVVYQADYLQGELFTMFPDRRLGNTYFCLSEHLELYE